MINCIFCGYELKSVIFLKDKEIYACGNNTYEPKHLLNLGIINNNSIYLAYDIHINEVTYGIKHYFTNSLPITNFTIYGEYGFVKEITLNYFAFLNTSIEQTILNIKKFILII